MAGRPKKSTVANESIENNKVESNPNSNLEKENAELKDTINQMKKMIEEMQAQKAISNTNETESDTNLEMTKRVTITSLSTGGVNLRTSVEGNAKRFRLEGIGQTIPIIYEDLINCINCDRWLFEDGIVYINDKKAVQENYLEEAYSKFLDVTKITHILDFDDYTIAEMLDNTTDEIRNTICVFIADKINKGEAVDMNKIVQIEKICNVDIRDLANKRR